MPQLKIVDLFLSYLLCCLFVLRRSKKYLRSEMLLRTQPFIHKTCLYHEWRLRLFFWNCTRFNRQQYLFSLSLDVISFCTLLNILHIRLLRIAEDDKKDSEISSKWLFNWNCKNILHQNIITRKAFPKLWIMQHTLGFLLLSRSEITFHLKTVKKLHVTFIF
jgi:hypothetical protein